MNPHANAGDMGLIADPGEDPTSATEQLRSWATTCALSLQGLNLLSPCVTKLIDAYA